MIILHPELAECLDLPEEISSILCPFCYANLVSKFDAISLLQCKCDNDFTLIKNNKTPGIYYFDTLYFNLYDSSIIANAAFKNVKLISFNKLEIPLICLDFRNIDILKQRIKLFLSHDYY